MMVRRTKKVVLATNKSDAERTTKSVDPGTKTESYRHPEASLLARPEAGQQARFKKRKPKATYRYDSSLAPEMNWDGQNPAREHGEWLIGRIEEAAKLKDTDSPFTFTEAENLRERGRQNRCARQRACRCHGSVAATVTAIPQLVREGGAAVL